MAKTTNKKITGSSGSDLLTGGDGDDELNGGNGRDSLYGGAGSDHLSGGEGDDYLDGGAGNDKLDGGSGNDTLIGGAGRDILNGDSGDDHFDGGAGNDDIDGGSGYNTARYHGLASDFRIAPVHKDGNGSTFGADIVQKGYTVTDLRVGAPEGVDTVRRVDVLQFDDRVVYVNGRNNGPVAAADSVATLEDALLRIPSSALLANDGDADGDALRIVAVSQGAHGGVVTLEPDGSVTYAPAADYSGQDSFTYTISDGRGGTSTATVTVSIAPVNDAPVAQSGSNAGDEDHLISGAVAASDADGDALTYSLVGSAPEGLTFNPDGSYTYDPRAVHNGLKQGESAQVSFQYRASDAQADSNVATVRLTITGVNDAPVAVDNRLQGVEDTGLTAAGGVLTGNDSDPDGDALTVTGVGPASHGVVALNPDGSVTYRPQADYFGPDSFTYTVSDGRGGTSSATVTVDVAPVNDAPVITSGEQTGTVYEGDGAAPTTASGQVSFFDVDSNDVQTYTASAANHGVATVNGSGGWSYTVSDTGAVDALAEGERLADRFTVTVTDSAGVAVSQDVTIDIIGTNDEAIVSSDTRNLVETGSAADISASGVLSVSDVDGPEAFIAQAGVAGNFGSFTIWADGEWSYTASSAHDEFAPGTTYTDSFDVSSADGTLASVTVNIRGTNDAAVLSSAAVVVDETDQPVTVGGILTVSDVDGPEAFVAQSGAAGTYGSFAIDAAGAWTYTANSAFDYLNQGEQLTDRFTVQSADGTATTVHVTINGTSDGAANHAIDDRASTDEDRAVTIAVLANDVNGAGAPLAVTSHGDGANGRVSLDEAGNLTYTPDADFFGQDSFSYTVDDGQGGASDATVTVDVRPVNDAPVAFSGIASGDEDRPITGAVSGSDVEHDSLSFRLLGDVEGLTFNADGSYRFDPTGVFNGLQEGESADLTFQFVASDSELDSAPASVTITVAGVNDAPLAGNDLIGGSEDGVVTIAASTLLGNDFDPDGDGLAIASVDGALAQFGDVELSSDGTSIIYRPNSNFAGSDSFSYVVDDGHGGLSTATVTLALDPVNDAPELTVPLRGRVMTFEDLPEIDFFDEMPAGYGGFNWSSPDGLLYVNGPAAGFAYTAGTVSGVHALVPEGGPQPGRVTWAGAPGGTFDWEGAYFTVFDGSPIVTLVGMQGEEIGGTDENPYTYTFELESVPQFVKVDWIGVTEIQIWGGGVIGDASIPSRWVMDDFTLAPIASVEDDSLLIPGIAVADVDNEDRMMTMTLGVDHGTVTVAGATGGLVISGNETALVTLTGTIDEINAALASGGGLSYLGNQDFNGRDYLRITTTDSGQGESPPLTDSKVLGIEVHKINDAPVAAADMAVTNQITPVVIDVLANDIDVDSARDELTVTLVEAASNGDVTVNGDGTVTYTAHGGFSGQDLFTYQVDDGLGGISSAQVTVHVASADNHAPALKASAPDAVEDQPRVYLASELASDPDFDLLSILLFAPSSGTAIIDDYGSSVTYIPGEDDNGTVTFEVVVSDGRGGEASGELSAYIAPTDDAPEAALVNYATQADLVLTVSVLENVTSPDGNTVFALVSVSQGEFGGGVTFDPETGMVFYDPSGVPAGFGEDLFTYTFEDTVNHLTGTGTVHVSLVSAELNVVDGTDDPDPEITGTAGRDLITGYAGVDTMTGGPGADIFRFVNSTDSSDNGTPGDESDDFIIYAGGNDIVTDFSQEEGDKLDVLDLLNASGWSGEPSTVMQFIEITNPGAGGDTTVYWDQDGAGGAYGSVPIATLQGVTGITLDDLLIPGA